MTRPLLALAVLALSLALGGCATSRSELRLATPGPSPAAAPASALPAGARGVVIRSVRDERVFEQAPREASTPSLGFEGAANATAEAKARAIGRKRNGFGKALGDVFLQEGQTVEGVVRANLAAALADAGLRVRDGSAGEPGDLLVDVHIRKFWAWLQPGFWAITVHGDIATDVEIAGGAEPVAIVASVADGRQLVTDGAWLETIEKTLQAWRQQAAAKLAAAK